jgi:hypothetical protein
MYTMMMLMATTNAQKEKDTKGGGQLITGSSYGRNSSTGLVNRALHFNSHENDRNLMEAAVLKLIQ